MSSRLEARLLVVTLVSCVSRVGFERRVSTNGDVRPGDSSSSGDSSSGDAFVEPATLTITSPTSNGTLIVYQSTVTVAGTCSVNARSLTTTIGSFIDADCSDGDWSLGDVDLDAGVHSFVVAAQNEVGAVVSDSLEITFELVRIRVPSNSPTFHQNGPGVLVGGDCSTTVTTPLTANTGTFVDADCTDGSFALTHTLPLGTITVTVMAYGGGPQRQDSIDLVFDDTAPTALRTPTVSDPSSGSNDNFPKIAGDGGATTLYRDSACQLVIGSGPNSVFSSTGIPVVAIDDGTTTIHASDADQAGNAGPCSAVPFDYVETSPPPVCDTMVSSAMTFLAFQTLLDGLEANRSAHDADGIIAVCLADGVQISTNDASEGGSIDIPGDGFEIFSPAGLATFANHRQGSWTIEAVFRPTTSRFNLGWANLILVSDGPSFDFAWMGGGGVSYLRNITAESDAVGIETLAYTRVAEISGCSFTVRNSSHATFALHNNTRIDVVQNSTLTWLGNDGGHAIRLGSAAAINEMIDVTVETTGGALSMAHNGEWGGASSLASIRDSIFRKRGDLTGQTMINLSTHQGSARTLPWFVTDLVSDNVFCTVDDAAPWDEMLAQDGVAFTGPTVPWTRDTDPAGSRGVQTFPWGDASTMGNPGSNIQAQWGGTCP